MTINPIPSSPTGDIMSSSAKDNVNVDIESSDSSQSTSDQQVAALDNAALARLGKTAVLPRNFGFLSTLGFCCCVLITWEASLPLFLAGLVNGGPSGILYGYLVVWAGTVSVAATLSELTSMAPTSGGQYHWVALLASPNTRNFLSYVTGWLTLAGWQAVVASACYLTGTMVQGLAVLTHPDYLDKAANWHGTLIFWAVLLFAFGVNTVLGTRFLAKFQDGVLALHVVGFFAILVPLVVMAPEPASAEEVWGTFLNMGGWQTQGLSVCLGLTGTIFAFAGIDAATHMAEEVRNAAVVIPKALMWSLLINGVLGFAMLIALLYCMGDLDAALQQNPAYPFMAIFNNVTGSKAGATVMVSIIAFMVISATTNVLAPASRLYWAFARDRAIPGWKFVNKIDPRTGLPLNAVIITAVVSVVLSFVNIGNPIAFNGVISISIAALFGSYLLASGLLLYRRTTGGIQSRYQGNDSSIPSSTEEAGLTWGPWRLPGIWGTANNIFSCVFLVFVEFFVFWPAVKDPTPQTMNWAVLPFGAVSIFSMVYYFAWARKTYVGPVVEA